jgi:hypothetical protein
MKRDNAIVKLVAASVKVSIIMAAFSHLRIEIHPIAQIIKKAKQKYFAFRRGTAGVLND